MSLLHKASAQLTDSGRWNEEFSFIEVRTPEDLARCEALIIPGGESTTIALIAAQSGLLEPLRDFVKYEQDGPYMVNLRDTNDAAESLASPPGAPAPASFCSQSKQMPPRKAVRS